MLSLLTNQVTKRAAKVKRKLTVLKFDELNVMQEIDSLCEWIAESNRIQFQKQYFARYAEVFLALTGKDALTADYEDTIDEIVEAHLSGLLSEPNDVTHYVYDTELLRKRDRAKEAILSVPTSAQKQIEIDKHIKYILQQTGFYADLVEDDATLTAMEDCGVKHVRWHTQEDRKVCNTCEDLDGNIYPIDSVPTKPHPRCRCYLIPID